MDEDFSWGSDNETEGTGGGWAIPSESKWEVKATNSNNKEKRDESKNEKATKKEITKEEKEEKADSVVKTDDWEAYEPRTNLCSLINKELNILSPHDHLRFG